MKLDLPDPVYNRLHKYSVIANLPVPSLIERWADYFEEKANNGGVAAVPAPVDVSDNQAQKFNPLRPPNLFHTRVRGTFGSAAFSTWNDLVRIAHIQAFEKAGSFEALKNVTHAQVQKGNYSENGYRFVPEIGISIQGVDANHAWLYSLKLAQFASASLRAAIEWRHNPKAFRPGAAGILEWSPLN